MFCWSVSGGRTPAVLTRLVAALERLGSDLIIYLRGCLPMCQQPSTDPTCRVAPDM